MTLDAELWRRVRCVACGRPADHTLELLLPIQKGTLTSVLVGFCLPHYKQAKRTPQWKDLPIIEATALEPKGVG